MEIWFPVGIGMFLIALLGGLAAALRFGKAYWLIAGYNTMTEEQKKNVDAEGMARFIAGGLFVACAVIAVAMVAIGTVLSLEETSHKPLRLV